MTSRIVTVGLVCASLYAAALGAGAVAQEEESTPAPTIAAETATPQAPESTTTATPSPFPSPVETVVEATPEPTQTSTPQADPTSEPTAAPTQAPTQTATPTADPTAPATATPRIGVDKTKRTRKHAKPNRAEGSAGTCPTGGRLIGTVGNASTSTSGRDCTPVKQDEDDHESGPLGGDTPAPTVQSNGVPTPAN